MKTFGITGQSPYLEMPSTAAPDPAYPSARPAAPSLPDSAESVFEGNPQQRSEIRAPLSLGMQARVLLPFSPLMTAYIHIQDHIAQYLSPHDLHSLSQTNRQLHKDFHPQVRARTLARISNMLPNIPQDERQTVANHLLSEMRSLQPAEVPEVLRNLVGLHTLIPSTPARTQFIRELFLLLDSLQARLPLVKNLLIAIDNMPILSLPLAERTKAFDTLLQILEHFVVNGAMPKICENLLSHLPHRLQHLPVNAQASAKNRLIVMQGALE